MSAVDTEVLVVGAGPAGLSAAALLAEYGVRSITVSKHPGTANSPRAHITNQRTMEVFRDLGLEERVRAVAVPNELMGDNVWATSFAGRELARLKAWGTAPLRQQDYAAASPTAMCNVPQHVLEPLILDGARERGADVRFSTELLHIWQTDDVVHAVVRDHNTGVEQTIRSRYAIGADGGRSTVAKKLGFQFDGRSGLGHAVNVWLHADLTRYTAHRPSTLYWMCQPGNDYWIGSGTFICVRPWDEWVMVFMYDPAEGRPDMSEEAVTARAAAVIGDPEVAITVKSISEWQINHLVAREFRRGRVFLAGDAAHRHPPANGLGTNTSIQDSYNLAWKLAFVLRGQAGPELLDSYDAERRPVGRQVVDRAMKSVEDMRPMSEAFGFHPGQSSEDGWRSVDDLFADTASGRRRRQALSEAIDLQNFNFNAHGVELGQRYDSSAVVPDGTMDAGSDRDPELYYQPTTRPGAHLPHVWLEHCNRRMSTLDITGRGRFTVVTGIGGQYWLDAAEKVAAEFGIELDGVLIGPGSEYLDVVGDWAQVREIDERGCLLVRPDRHIAWRSHDHGDDAVGMLRSVLAAVLHRCADGPLSGASRGVYREAP
ncbi:FAD-dependent monooxygenase [Lentzea alba]|uniref:FAD-dependent monooxygenase n=1 Tax=Lentzea alba TaxID=2714351 RepID=UPI0039BFFDDC